MRTGGGRVGRAAGIAVASSGLCVAVRLLAVSAADNVDIRGTWNWVTQANGTTYPQTVTIADEDTSSGAISGTDVGAGQTFSVTGKVVGNSFTVTITDITAPGYIAHCDGTVGSSGGQRTWTGTCSDTNGTHSTYLATSAGAAAPATTGGATAAQALVTTGGGSGSGWFAVTAGGIGVLVVIGAAAAVTTHQVRARRAPRPSFDPPDLPDPGGGGDEVSPRA